MEGSVMEDSMPTFDSLRKPINHSHHSAAPSKNAELIEAAALLTMWSLLVINEGSIRLNNTAPSVALLAAGRPSKLIIFSAALSEVIFGVVGLLVGVAAFMLRWYSTAAVKACMLLQTVLGYYVFAVYVFVIPIYSVIDRADPLVVGLTLEQTRIVMILGVLTSFHFCLALQGGQFVFMARLIVAGSGDEFLYQRGGSRMRAVFWNGNLGLAGLWTLITGVCMAINAEGGWRLAMPYVSPPNVGVLPGMTIWTGLVMLVWGSLGVLLALRGRVVPKNYFVVSGYVYVAAMLNYGIVQFGLFATADGNSSPSWAVALHNGLVFMVVFMGAYFLNQVSEEKEEKEDQL